VRELWLCRHAEARGGAGVDDHERDLSASGVREAEALAAMLADSGSVPGRVLTSTALRARRTAEIVFGDLVPRSEILVFRELYLAAPATIRRVIAEAGGDARVLAVVGHNPGLHVFARDLAAEGDAAGLEMKWAMFPPCALARIALPIDDWRRIGRTGGRLLAFVRPAGREGRP
jgi:phosphohistidine phosphatase